jgi:hypothetical protein
MSAALSAHPAAAVQPAILYHPGPHMMHWTRAQAAIRDRGHFANITLDGLLCVYGTVCPGRPEDPFVDGMVVFPVRDDETVETAPIRDWLALNAGAAATT